MSTWWGDSKNMEEIEFSRWLFEGRPRQGKNVLPGGLNWLCYLACSSKSHRENSISCIIFGIPLSIRHDKCCKILQTLFLVFQYPRNSQCNMICLISYFSLFSSILILRNTKIEFSYYVLTNFKGISQTTNNGLKGSFNISSINIFSKRVLKSFGKLNFMHGLL